MSDEPKNSIPLPNGVKRPIQRQPDGAGFYVHYTGGLRAIEHGRDSWFIEPVFDGGPCARGIASRSQVHAILRQCGLKPIAFHRMGWHDGVYNSSWSPIVPGRTNNMFAPADMWGQITGNLSRLRTDEDLKSLRSCTREQIAQLMDARGEVERLAHSISLSLKNIDISVEQIAEFYHEQLVNHMAGNVLDEKFLTTTLDQTLYAHVNAFFMHLGAARDYLGALIVLRLGKDHRKHDSMAKLFEVVRMGDFTNDSIMAAVAAKGYARKKAASVDKVELFGWLAEVTEMRNHFIHRRPYGYMFSEKMGLAKAIDKDNGIYRYFRPIIIDDVEHDVLDFILHHYQILCSMFLDCADMSGYDTQVMIITDEDIISAVIHEER